MVFLRFKGRGSVDTAYRHQVRARQAAPASRPATLPASGAPTPPKSAGGLAPGARVEVEEGAGGRHLAVVTEVRDGMVYVRYDEPGTWRDGKVDAYRPGGVQLASTQAIAAAKAARAQAELGFDLTGAWIIDITGGAWTRTKYEDADRRTLRKVVEIEIQRGTSNLGMLEIRPGGTYTINYRGIRTGRWEKDGAGPYSRLGGIVLRGAHWNPKQAERDWYVFARDGGVEASPPPYVAVGNYTLKKMLSQPALRPF